MFGRVSKRLRPRAYDGLYGNPITTEIDMAVRWAPRRQQAEAALSTQRYEIFLILCSLASQLATRGAKSASFGIRSLVLSHKHSAFRRDGQ